MSASKGQLVEVQITSGRWSLALVTRIVSGDTVALVALTDAVDPWPTVDTPNGLVAGSISSVAKGSGVGQWREVTLPAATLAAIASAVATALADYATEGDIDVAVAAALVTAASNLAGAVSSIGATTTDLGNTLDGLADTVDGLAAGAITMGAVDDAIEEAVESIPPVDLAGLLVVPGTCYAVTGLAMNTYRNPSSERGDGRPTLVTAVVSWSFSLAGSAAATLEVIIGPGASPTTVRFSVPFSVGLGLLSVSQTIPSVLTFPVPSGSSYKFHAATGSAGTLAIASVSETAG